MNSEFGIQNSEAAGAFLDGGLDAGDPIQRVRFRPEPARGVAVAQLFLEERGWTEGVREVERVGGVGAAIQHQRLVVAARRRVLSRDAAVQIAEMPDGVRQQQEIAFVAAERDRFHIERQRAIGVPGVANDMGERLERANQRQPFTGRAAGVDGLDETALRVGGTALTPRLPRDVDQVLDGRQVSAPRR